MRVIKHKVLAIAVLTSALLPDSAHAQLLFSKWTPLYGLKETVVQDTTSVKLKNLKSTDTVSLALTDAIQIALSGSEEVRLARAQISLAKTQVTAARAQALPQINGNISYTRTLASPFEGGGGFAIPDSMKFSPDTTASIADRIRYLERNAPNAGLGGLGSLFSDLPFGQEHTYTGTLSASQLLYSGGRTGAALKIAARYVEAAELTYTEEVASLELEVLTAYYRAQLAQELESISAAGVEQAQKFLDDEQLRFKAGMVSELEVLRAEVALENLRPQLVEARNSRELATLDLKRLLNIPISAGVLLTSQLQAPVSSGDSLGDAEDMATELNSRASVRAAEKQVAIREQQIKIARGAYLPSLSLDFRYGGVLYPGKTFDFSGTDLRKDAAAIVTMQVPIFAGFKRRAEYQQAQIERDRAELQLSQFKEGIQLEYERARGERNRALASISARKRTVEQAERVYDLTVLRYEKGLATQLEASDARLALLQARTNFVMALSDYYIADAEVNKSLGRRTVSEATR